MLPGPPTSTLFPTRRSSDLLGVGGERLHLARLEQLLGVQVGDRQRLGALVEGFGLGDHVAVLVERLDAELNVAELVPARVLEPADDVVELGPVARLPAALVLEHLGAGGVRGARGRGQEEHPENDRAAPHESVMWVSVRSEKYDGSQLCSRNELW